MSNPAIAAAHIQSLFALGDIAGAQAAAAAAVAATPANPQLNNLLALTYLQQGRFADALAPLQTALASARNDAGLLVNLGRTLGALRRPAEALPHFQRAAEVAPSVFEAWEGQARILHTLERYSDAADAARRAHAVRPADPAMAAMYIGLLMHTARVAQAVEFGRYWLARAQHPLVAGALAVAMTYHEGADPREVFEAQAAFGRTLGSPPSAPHANTPDPDRPIRVALLSHELRRHAVATFLEPWLEHHDRARIRIACFATAGLEDEVSDRIKGHTASWVNLHGRHAQDIARLIREDAADILIETSGLTDGHRLDAVCLRPAPVQATMIGYLNTTGVPALDHRIVDIHTDPMGGTADALSVEHLQRLDPTYWCYRAPESAPDPAPPDESRAPVFGSFNTASKINDRVIEVWAACLAAAPGSRLILKSFDFADPRVCADLLARFSAYGIGPDRLEIEGPTHGMGAFLANYHRIDIALDPFPFNGTTTTLDALWMGVPVVCLAGRMHAGRTGVSILTTLGLPELLATDHAAYIRVAADLAADRARLADLRRTLRPRLAASPLCDGPGHARRMDAALRDMWQRWCVQQRR